LNTRIFAGFWVAVISVALFPFQAAEAQTTPSDQIAQQRALLDQYCVACHNARTNVGQQTGLFLDEFDLASVRDHAEVGENILRKVSAGLMPPSGARRPSPEELASLVKWMEDEIDGGSEIHLPAPGLHRLNRAEYTNAIRDLIALEIDAADFLPSDDSSHGFDNMAGTLTMSPALMEAYLSAAGKISRLAIRSPAIPIKAGFHTVGVTFLATNDLPDTEINRPFMRTMNSPGFIPGFNFYPHVGQVFLEGPYNGIRARGTRSQDKIFLCRPETNSEEAECAREIVSTLVQSAFRRPPAAGDIELLMDFFDMGREEGQNFDSGIEAALERILADPEFIYRAEIEPSQLAAGETYRIGGLELASRLSFFMWSSIPDDELIELAVAGRLSDPAVLEQQVQRMIVDPRAEALIDNFTGQWLNVRGMAASEPVVEMFPDFDSQLRDAYAREIEMFFASIVHEDRSILDLLTADYTFVNERLAKQYGIPDLYGSQFRRVALGPDLDMRRGLLGKGALLTVTSQANRTSPVQRGKWFLETFLGVSPPDPPPGVETDLAADPNADAPRTLRARLEAHRANPVCSSCHNIFEPMGMALENFDAVGTWRTHDAGVPVDPTGVIADGTPLEGVHSLREVLVERSDQFAKVVIEKLLTYALGRGVEYQDMPIVRSIAQGAADSNYQFSSILMGIVESPAFQMNMKATEDLQQQAAR
jgi:mono/diheme cytochrome c family protein